MNEKISWEQIKDLIDVAIAAERDFTLNIFADGKTTVSLDIP